MAPNCHPGQNLLNLPEEKPFESVGYHEFKAGISTS